MLLVLGKQIELNFICYDFYSKLYAQLLSYFKLYAKLLLNYYTCLLHVPLCCARMHYFSITCNVDTASFLKHCNRYAHDIANTSCVISVPKFSAWWWLLNHCFTQGFLWPPKLCFLTPNFSFLLLNLSSQHHYFCL